MIVKLLTEHHLEFLSLKGGCTGSSKSTLVKMSNCWKAHAATHFIFNHSNKCFNKIMYTISYQNVEQLDESLENNNDIIFQA